MTDHDQWTGISDLETLTALLGEPAPAVRDKARSSLTEVDVAWLEASPFCVVATSSAAGGADASPKGDPAGQLVHVIDATTIALAERPGNRRADGYRNILENPNVGMLFLIPGRGDTLRINGRARLVSDAPFFDDLVVKGHRPLLAMVVEIDELFHHCAKAFLRSKLWEPESWDPEAVVARRAVLAQKLERPEATVDELDLYYGPSYADGLYRNPGA
jgi:PPOX class probable FMN-dependent enzyme